MCNTKERRISWFYSKIDIIMEEKKLPTKEELKNLSPKELADYKLELSQLSLEIDELIKKCDDILSK